MKSEDIGQRICEIRMALGITGPKMSKKLGITQAQISRLENGLQGFRAGTLESICELLGVPPMYFFVDDDQPFTLKCDEQLAKKDLRMSRRLRKALTNPAFLKFLEARSEDFKDDRELLKPMKGAIEEAVP